MLAGSSGLYGKSRRRLCVPAGLMGVDAAFGGVGRWFGGPGGGERGGLTQMCWGVVGCAFGGLWWCFVGVYDYDKGREWWWKG